MGNILSNMPTGAVPGDNTQDGIVVTVTIQENGGRHARRRAPVVVSDVGRPRPRPRHPIGAHGPRRPVDTGVAASSARGLARTHPSASSATSSSSAERRAPPLRERRDDHHGVGSSRTSDVREPRRTATVFETHEGIRRRRGSGSDATATAPVLAALQRRRRVRRAAADRSICETLSDLLDGRAPRCPISTSWRGLLPGALHVLDAVDEAARLEVVGLAGDPHVRAGGRGSPRTSRRSRDGRGWRRGRSAGRRRRSRPAAAATGRRTSNV